MPAVRRLPTVDELAGTWRVTGSLPDRADGAPVPAATALLDVSREELRWTYVPAGGFAGSADSCQGPVIEPQTANSAARQIARMLASASRVSVEPDDVWGWTCAEGRFGPGQTGTSNSALMPDGRLAMTWHDGAVLRLVRIRRPGASADDAGVRADDYAN